MFYLDRYQFLYCGTVQVLIDQRNLVEYGSVVDGCDHVRISNGITCGKAHRFLLDNAALIHTAYNFVSQYICCGYSLGA